MCVCGLMSKYVKVLNYFRPEFWPAPSSLQTKLHGTREDLLTTAEFIVLTGLLVQILRTKEGSKEGFSVRSGNQFC